MKKIKNEDESIQNVDQSLIKSTATTMEGRENELIALAYDAVEQRIRNGTATSAELCHFLTLGSTRSRLQKECLTADTELKRAKVEAIHQAEISDETYREAIAAMKRYSGN